MVDTLPGSPKQPASCQDPTLSAPLLPPDLIKCYISHHALELPAQRLLAALKTSLYSSTWAPRHQILPAHALLRLAKDAGV